MKEFSLVKTARARILHVTASSTQRHLWYHDEYVATLCGLWLHVHDMHTDMNLDNVKALDGSLCSNCQRRYLNVG